MRSEGARLDELAASVADGSEVDWTGAERGLDADERPLARHLRLVQSIASLYRSIPDDAVVPDVDDITGTISGEAWGPLVILERLGHGTSAEVFRAFERTLHREVALKLLHDRDGADGQATALAEARRLARLDHRHVVRVYGAGQHNDRAGIWMELVRGETLAEAVRSRGPMAPGEVSAIGQDVCAGLAAVHVAGLLHRDVKAQNVVRENGGRIVLMDLGTGSPLRNGRGPVSLAGTPLYLAPEILSGAPASIASDVYSAGVLLFHLATGEFPVLAATFDELKRAHAEGHAKRLLDVRADLPPRFAGVIERALDRDPGRRYATAGALEAALRDWAGPDTARPETPRRRGIRPPVIVVAMAIAAGAALVPFAWTHWGPHPAQASPIASIAVLPLEDLSGGRAPAGFVPGLTDQLVATLGQVSSLRVAPRTTTLALARGKPTIPALAEALHVDAVVEGTVTVVPGGAPGAPDRARINIRLISAGWDGTLLSKVFDRPLSDTLGLQAEVAQQLAKEVDRLRATTPPALTRNTNPAAVSAYLEGRDHLEYGAARASLALRLFSRALELDPDMAVAHAGLARAYVSLGFNGAITQAEAYEAARKAAERAIELDPSLPEAYAARGDVRFYYDWDLANARSDYDYALGLNPSDARLRSQLADLLWSEGRFDDAAAELEQLAATDDLSPILQVNLGMVRLYNRQFAQARDAFERARALDPSMTSAYIGLGRVAESQRRYADALALTEQALSMAGSGSVPLAIQRLCLLAKSGNVASARAGYDALDREATARGVPVPAESRAYMHLAFGEYDQALDLLESAVADRHPAILWLAGDPRMEPIRSNPRFTALVAHLRR